MVSKLIILVLVLNITRNSSYCWVLTDIDNRALIENSIDDLGLELSAEEVAQLRRDIKLIFPGVFFEANRGAAAAAIATRGGTKWCGPGDNAESYDDLGTAKVTDICCRAHDNCDAIPSGETKHNLTNTAYYTRLHCECDEEFRQCLRTANTKTSHTVGMTYFNVIGTQCYRNDYPVTGCKRKGGWLNTKCVEYSYDMCGEKLYQWFDVPKY